MTNTFSISLDSDLQEMGRVTEFVHRISAHIGCDEEQEHHIMLALTEAVTNAVVHGNKYDRSKEVVIHAEYGGDILVLTVQDEGDGFDPDSIPDPRKSENLLKPGGRGVWLIREYADEVNFHDKGRCVEMRFHVKS